MLTAFQCEVIAYLGDGDVYCPTCVMESPHVELGRPLVDAALIRYTVDEEWPGGLDCGSCGEVIVEPAEDYCSAHDGWKDGVEDGIPYCDQVDGPGSCTYDPEEE